MNPNSTPKTVKPAEERYVSVYYLDAIGGGSGFTRMMLKEVPAWLSEHPGRLIRAISQA